MNNTDLDSKAPMAPRYNAYKDSGIAWLGEVPKHWSISQLKRKTKVYSGSTPKSDNENYWDGTIEWYTPEDLGKNSKKVIGSSRRKITQAGFDNCGVSLTPSNTIVVSTRAPIGHLAMTEGFSCINQGCKSLVFKHDNSDYFFYLFHAGKDDLKSFGQGTTFMELPKSKMESFLIAVPPLPEQQAIAAYLDEKTTRLDKLIANKREQITQLETLRNVTIQHAVTKGLSPDAPMKDSGIAWLGKVPAHWEVKRLKTFLNDIEQGWSPQCENRPAESNEWAVLKVGCVNGGVFSKQENKALPKDESPKKEYLINKGDILASRANTRELLGSCCLVDNEYPRLILCDKLYRLDIQTSQLNKQFFIHFMQTRMARYQIESKATGASDSMQNIAQSVLEEILMAIPAEHEQQAIAAYLDEQTAKLDKLIANQREQTQQLETLRKVTIHDAVTGKINVSGLEV